jgi:hypothetical protein
VVTVIDPRVFAPDGIALAGTTACNLSGGGQLGWRMHDGSAP